MLSRRLVQAVVKNFAGPMVISLILVFLLVGCESDDQREALPGPLTAISGNVSDHYRDLPIADFKVSLIKYWGCGNGWTPVTCDMEIASAQTDQNGNYVLNFEYNLREDETYRIVFEDSTPYRIEFPGWPLEPVFNAGVTNILNINAWTPVKLRIHLTTLNNHTPPLVSGVRVNNDIEFGVKFISESDPFITYDLIARPNTAVSLDFWYNENYNSNQPIRHSIQFPYTTNLDPVTELVYEIDCNTF